MLIALTVALVLFSILLHEISHILLMRKYGIRVQTLSFGLPFFTRIEISNRRFLGDMKIHLTPLLLGAYVAPHPDDIERIWELPYKKLSEICAAGPIANLIFGSVLFLASQTQNDPLKIIIACGITVVLLVGGFKLISHYIILPLGIAMMILIVAAIMHTPAETSASAATLEPIVRSISDFTKSIRMAGLISIELGLLNILPLFPLDGGRIFHALIGKTRIATAYQFISGIMLILLFAVVLSGIF